MQKQRKIVKQDKVITIKHNQKYLLPPQELLKIFWAKSFLLFCRNRKPHQVEEVNCMLPTRTQNLEAWWYWFLIPHNPPIRRYLWTDHIPCNPLPHPVFKNLSLKAIGSFCALSTNCLDSLLGACNKCCTFLHHKPVSVDWVYCMQGEYKFGSVTKIFSLNISCNIPMLKNYSLFISSLFYWVLCIFIF